MIIASKFFLAKSLPDNKFGTRICSGVNGIGEDNGSKDYTLLEAVVFDTIFDRIMQQDKPTAKFMDNQSEYQVSAIKATESLDSENRLIEIRNSIYKSMENDNDLKQYLLSYLTHSN